MHQEISDRATQLMGKEVSRKEFLGMAGLTLVSVMGFGTIYKLLTGQSFTAPAVNNQQTPAGYGASSYGR